MAEVFFDNPPVLNGAEKEQILQLQRYLNAMSEKLNIALMDISIGQLNPEIRNVVEGAEEKNAAEAESLKSMIVKTATIVRHEMETITATLTDQYTALSDQFGAYERNLQSEITATAEGILQDYHFDQLVTDTATNTFFRQQTNQYIFTGLINTSPVEYGIAIGEGVTAYDQNGNPYLNQNAKVATFTMNKLAFWQGTTQLAYFSSGKFYITNGEITNTLQIGNYVFKKMADDSMVLVRI